MGLEAIGAKIAQGSQAAARYAGYRIPAPSTQQMTLGVVSAADMVIGDRSWTDIILNAAGIASLFYAPLILPVAIGYGIKAAMYLVGDPTKLLTGGFMKSGAIGSLLTGDFGGCLKNLFVAGVSLLGALPIIGNGFKAMKGAWTAALGANGGKYTTGFFEQFSDDVVKAYAGGNMLIHQGYQEGVRTFKTADPNANFFAKLLSAIKKYFSVAGSNIEKVSKSAAQSSRQLEFNWAA
ncbi:MAG: hypothetical protein A3B68_09505 [Candidatus Melainabacteria bacterium RIFCSPHIGHO2_02_FULL_34_12]|nr:MAG: hypothetical protein A3B68_09505 [Candidatus Melainabacteria bacterium RIFCSPHIGHO2_02_FULL_34_12]